MFKPGDLVVTKSNVYWQGQDIGEHLGRVVSTSGYTIVNVYGCENNPVKCLTYELEPAKVTEDINIDEEIDNILSELEIP